MVQFVALLEFCFEDIASSRIHYLFFSEIYNKHF